MRERTKFVLEVNGMKYPVKIHYEKRNDCIASIRKRSINIRIPSYLSEEEKHKQLTKLKQWAIEKIKEDPERFKLESRREYIDGDIITVGSEEYVLNIVFRDKRGSSARIEGSDIQFIISSNLSKEDRNRHISTLLSRCIAQKRVPDLRKRIDELNSNHFNKPINKIFFKHNKTNWGSCSNMGNINISTRLLFAPDDVLDYVCVHELAHLIERNHSKDFWNLVEKAMPDYKEKVKWLKENGNTCKF
ncbi:MAG: M48 family metallopeptidase [Candidatus Thermoplasmatota archaeon]|nr:M48 family metallopeptidase [Candidatus Thermoplasmatota archaeon]